MTEREKIVDRVRKLLAMSTSSNEAEAAAFAAKAQALLAEHNLSLAEVQTLDKKEDEDLIMDSDLETDSRPWRRSLGTMVAKMYFCTYFYTFNKKYTKARACGYIRYDVHSFVGAAHNVMIAKMMFHYLNDTIARLAKEASEEVPVQKRTAFRTSFQHSCASRLCKRIEERIAAAKRGENTGSSGTNLPALLDVYEKAHKTTWAFAEKALGNELVTGKDRGKITSIEGSHAGWIAGASIGLDDQLEENKAKKIAQK